MAPSASSSSIDESAQSPGKWVFSPVDVASILASGQDTLALTDTELCHHLQKVARIRVGEAVVVVDEGGSGALQGTVASLDRKSITLENLAPHPLANTGIPPVTMAMSLIKEQRWDWAIQKLTELGVAEVQPLITQHTTVKVHDPESKCQRWERIARQAAQQSEGAFIPPVHAPQPWEEVCQAQEGQPYHRAILVARHPQSQPFLKWWGQRSPSSPTATDNESPASRVAVGPEGGWSAEEIEKAVAAGWTPVTLSPRILRAETAAIAAMALINGAS